MIEVRDLRKAFQMGRTAVNALAGVTLDVPEGAFRAVMGPSGSGKSTLLNLIGGLDRATAGALRVAGQEITTLDENGLAIYRQHMCGFIFQSFNLVGTMTALQNVEFPMVFARVPPRERRRKARYLLEAVGLADRLDHQAHRTFGRRAAAGGGGAGAGQLAAAPAGGRTDGQSGFAHGRRDHGTDPACPSRGALDGADGDARSGHRRARAGGDPHARRPDPTGWGLTCTDHLNR